MADLTPFQTVGPYFALAVPAPGQQPFPDHAGPRIRIEGILTDGAGAPVPDGLIETWQADPAGRYHRHDGDGSGAGRIPTDDQGRFVIDTLRPDQVPGPEGRPQAPHLVFRVLARGILTRLVSRIYFEDEPSNESDPVLSLVPLARRSRLIARQVAAGRFRFDIVLQGREETVFFDV